VSREIVAIAVLGPDQLPLLILHCRVPERTLPELLTASERVNDPVRLALFHLQGCDTCTESVVCERGTRLIDACRGWRERTR
jgi:hypothetical protein